MIQVLLVDDHDLMRNGIKLMLGEADDIKVIGEACTGEEAIEQSQLLKPDVVLMDVEMPGIGGLEATRKLLRIQPETRIIILSVHDEDPFPNQLLDAGADGYMSKHCGVNDIINAIHTVHRGRKYIEPEIAQKIAEAMLNGKSNPFAELSNREMQVMLMVSKGYSIQEISDSLHLSPKTISTYRYRLYEKLKVQNDVELTRMAIRHGLVDTSERTD